MQTLHWAELQARPLRPGFTERHPKTATALVALAVGAVYGLLLLGGMWIGGM